MPTKTLSTFVITKKEKEKQKNSTLIPKSGSINVNECLFGNKSKTDIKDIKAKKLN